MNGLTIYYQKICQIIEQIKIYTVVFTGGRTNHLFSDLSESGTASIFWKSKKFDVDYLSAQPKRQKICLEQYSTTSEGNIYFTLLKLLNGEIITNSGDFNPSKDTLHIFCDKPRYLKIQVICLFYLRSNGLKYRINSCNRIDITKKSTWYYQLFIAIPKMLLQQNFWKNYDHLKKLIAISQF